MFKLQNLCTVKDNTLNGPMSPMLLMQDVAKQLDEKYSGICRVSWTNDRTMQLVDEDSGLDTIVYLAKYMTYTTLSMFVDTGTGAMPVAICFISDETIFAPAYKEDTTLVKASKAEIEAVFDAMVSDMSVIIPKEA